LRRVENTSVSRIPVDEREQTLLAKRLGFATAADFMEAYRRATGKIRGLYKQILGA
jgi:glutamine synthetase adenylyltransferase